MPEPTRLSAETEATIRKHAAPRSVTVRVLLTELDAVRAELAEYKRKVEQGRSPGLDWISEHGGT